VSLDDGTCTSCGGDLNAKPPAVTAPSPGQAAIEAAAKAAYEAFLPGGPIDWEYADSEVREYWKNAAQAAIAAAPACPCGGMPGTACGDLIAQLRARHGIPVSKPPKTEDEEFPETFDDVLCDTPAFFDPHHPAEVSCRCQLRRGHQGAHLGYLAARWDTQAARRTGGVT
jgi:hypothetical protein